MLLNSEAASDAILDLSDVILDFSGESLIWSGVRIFGESSRIGEPISNWIDPLPSSSTGNGISRLSYSIIKVPLSFPALCSRIYEFKHFLKWMPVSFCLFCMPEKRMDVL